MGLSWALLFLLLDIVDTIGWVRGEVFVGHVQQISMPDRVS